MGTRDGRDARPPSKNCMNFLRSEVRRPTSVAAGLALAGYEDGGAGAAPARAVGEGVQNAGYSGIGRQNSQHYDCDGSKGDNESNQ